MADVTALKEEGRNFNCLECPERIQKLRRCREEREDFTEVDNPSVFPMYVNRGGELYGFCPAKATWDPELASTFRLLMIVAGPLFARHNDRLAHDIEQRVADDPAELAKVEGARMDKVNAYWPRAKQSWAVIALLAMGMVLFVKHEWAHGLGLALLLRY